MQLVFSSNIKDLDPSCYHEEARIGLHKSRLGKLTHCDLFSLLVVFIAVVVRVIFVMAEWMILFTTVKTNKTLKQTPENKQTATNEGNKLSP